MARRERTYTYKEPFFAPRGIAATIMGLFSMVVFIAMVIIGSVTEVSGKASGVLIILAVTMALIGLIEGLDSLKDRCKSMVFSRIGAIYCSAMVALWFLVYCLGFSAH